MDFFIFMSCAGKLYELKPRRPSTAHDNIHVTAFDSSPLAPDFGFIAHDEGSVIYKLTTEWEILSIIARPQKINMYSLTMREF